MDRDVGIADAGKERIAGGGKVGRVFTKVSDLPNANVQIQRVQLDSHGSCAT
jgi:hypothetical protein